MTKIKRYEQNNTASGDDKYSCVIILEIEYTVKEFIEAILTRSFILMNMDISKLIMKHRCI